MANAMVVSLRICSDQFRVPINAANKRKIICSAIRDVCKYYCAYVSPVSFGRCVSSTITAQARALTGAGFFDKKSKSIGASVREAADCAMSVGTTALPITAVSRIVY